MTELCANCGKVLAVHWNEGGNLYCTGNPRDLRKWTPPDPQGTLLDVSAVKTGYEL